MTGGDDAVLRFWRTNDWGLDRSITRPHAIRALAFSPDGATIAIAAFNVGQVALINPEDGSTVRTLSGGIGAQNGVVFSTDGQRIAAGFVDGTARVWRTSDGALLSTFAGHGTPVNAVAFAPDGRTILTGAGDGAVRVWNLDGSLRHLLFGHQGEVRAVAFLQGEEGLLSAGADGAILRWSVADGRLVEEITAHRGYATSVAYSPDGSTVATGGSDGRAVLWRASDGERLRTFTAPSLVEAVRFSTDGKLLFGAIGNDILAWDAETGEVTKTFRGHNGKVLAISGGPDGTYLASASADRSIRLWRISDAVLVSSIEIPSASLAALDFSPDGSLLASASGPYGSGMVQLWRVPDLSPQWPTAVSANNTFVRFAPDGLHVLAGSGRDLKLLRVEDGALIRHFPGFYYTDRCGDLSPDGDLAVSGGDEGLWVWKVAAGFRMRIYYDGIRAIAYSPKGDRMGYVTASQLICSARMPPDSVSCPQIVYLDARMRTSLSAWPTLVRIDSGAPFVTHLYFYPSEDTTLVGWWWQVLSATGTQRVWVQPAGFLAQALAVSPNGLGLSVRYRGPRGQGLLPGDTNDDNRIDEADLVAVLREFGGPPTGARGWTDTNGDRMVDLSDLNNVLLSFGLDGDEL